MVKFVSKLHTNKMIEARDEIVDGANVITEFAGSNSFPIVDNDIYFYWCCNNVRRATASLLKSEIG